MPHLRARTNTFSAAFRVRSAAAFAIHKFLQEQGFVYVHTPLITGSDCEGAGEMFRVTTLDLNALPLGEDGKVDCTKDFFGRATNLTVSGQLEGEAMATAFGKIYTFGPTFRAENSNTPRHAAEFWMIEPEIAFADLSDEMDLSEAMVKSVIRYVLDTCPDEIDFFHPVFSTKSCAPGWSMWLQASLCAFPTRRLWNCWKKQNSAFQYQVEWGTDLQTEHERYLTEQVYKKACVRHRLPQKKSSRSTCA